MGNEFFRYLVVLLQQPGYLGPLGMQIINKELTKLIGSTRGKETYYERSPLGKTSFSFTHKMYPELQEIHLKEAEVRNVFFSNYITKAIIKADFRINDKRAISLIKSSCKFGQLYNPATSTIKYDDDDWTDEEDVMSEADDTIDQEGDDEIGEVIEKKTEDKESKDDSFYEESSTDDEEGSIGDIEELEGMDSLKKVMKNVKRMSIKRLPSALAAKILL
ncbi:hypothetical protein MBANPS3_012249 [Mucor bainieri]